MAAADKLAQITEGARVHAVYQADGEYYPATVVQVSVSNIQRAKKPVKVNYNGYDEEVWVGLGQLKSKKLGLTASEAPAPKAKAKAKVKKPDFSEFTKGLKLQVKDEGDGKHYPAEVVTVNQKKEQVKIHWTGYTKASDEWATADRIRSKHLKFVDAGRAKTTTLGEPILDGLPIVVPQILMPREGISLDKWATVACDQFESEPAYWKEMAEHAAGQPSALNVIFPEVYLASVTRADPSEDTKRIEEIGKTMKQYVADGVFRERAPAFLALDRKTAEVPSRKGLIVAVDLDEYNYNCPEPTLIRPTEKTIVERLPPRIAIRQDAPLELPHIIMIVDDPEKSVLEPLFTTDGLTEPEYECNLFKGAGSVKGLTVTKKGAKHFETTMKALAKKEFAAAKAAKRKPSTILIGDGNHSLATAKSCWENLKKEGGVDKLRHPARYALVELQNLHDDGVVFEPIHRILEGAKADDVQGALEKAWGVTATPFTDPAPLHSVVVVRKEGKFTLIPPKEFLPIVSITEPMDEFVKAHPEVNIGYVHGEEPVNDAVKAGHGVGLLLPKLDKTRFLETVHQVGTLPRKAFSMGEANEKRFYIEARNILPK